MPAPSTRPLAIHTTEDLDGEIKDLGGLDLHDLRRRWRQRLRSAPPAALGRPLLLRLLAYRLQAKAFGDLNPETIKVLDEVARDNARRRTAAAKPMPKAVPPIPPVPPTRGLKPGTLLVREYGGVMHRVIVMVDGFAWNGTTYSNLSAIAVAITGTHWNGPRFFGLRDKGATQGNAAAGDVVGACSRPDRKKGAR